MKPPNDLKDLPALLIIILGVFLPWGCSGDFVSICEPGITIEYRQQLLFTDHGGIIILVFAFLTSLVLHLDLISFQWKFAPVLAGFTGITTSLATWGLSLSHLDKWIVRMGVEEQFTGGAQPQDGIFLVVLGTACLLYLSIRKTWEAVSQFRHQKARYEGFD